MNVYVIGVLIYINRHILNWELKYIRMLSTYVVDHHAPQQETYFNDIKKGYPQNLLVVIPYERKQNQNELPPKLNLKIDLFYRKFFLSDTLFITSWKTMVYFTGANQDSHKDLWFSVFSFFG